MRKKLFEPVRIGGTEIKNRIAMGPMLIAGLINPDGSLTQRAIDYYIERAKGGVGLIITSVFKVENDIEQMRLGVLPLVSATMLPPLGELCECIHSLGTKIFIQLTAGFGRVATTKRLLVKPVSASALPNYWDPNIVCRELTIEEVEKLAEEFGNAARLVKAAGADGIELHGRGGYLFDQFATSIWNKRTDKYGGDLKNRLRFPIEALQEVRKAVGKDFPVLYRYSPKHYIKGSGVAVVPGEKYTEAGRDIKAGLEMSKLLEDAGFDALNVDGGCYESWYWAKPPLYHEYGCLVDLAAKVKQVVKIPVMAAGKLDLPELAEEVVEEGKADIIVLARGLLADPDWPVKVQEGKIEDIRPCIGCHRACSGRTNENKPLSCAVNPAAGRERLYELKTAMRTKDILIVGGGVAGMEAARVAAIRGHRVTLYEKGKSLGGHLIEASVPDFKNDVKRLLLWYVNELDKLKVQTEFNVEISAALIEKKKPDVVLVATGSQPVTPNIPGISNLNVGTCVDLFLGKKQIGESVAIIGGGLIGCEMALWLVKQGKKVTIIEQLPELMTAGMIVHRTNRMMLLDLLASNNIRIECNVSVQEISGADIVVSDNKTRVRKMVRVDSVGLSTGFESDKALYDSLIGEIAYLYALGDCREPGDIMTAIWDAYEVARMI
ncbi:FAD-dependent oxidoreductase [Chloroflexota bacterium]